MERSESASPFLKKDENDEESPFESDSEDEDSDSEIFVKEPSVSSHRINISCLEGDIVKYGNSVS